MMVLVCGHIPAWQARLCLQPVSSAEFLLLFRFTGSVVTRLEFPLPEHQLCEVCSFTRRSSATNLTGQHRLTTVAIQAERRPFFPCSVKPELISTFCSFHHFWFFLFFFLMLQPLPSPCFSSEFQLQYTGTL